MKKKPRGKRVSRWLWFERNFLENVSEFQRWTNIDVAEALGISPAEATLLIQEYLRAMRLKRSSFSIQRRGNTSNALWTRGERRRHLTIRVRQWEGDLRTMTATMDKDLDQLGNLNPSLQAKVNAARANAEVSVRVLVMTIENALKEAV